MVYVILGKKPHNSRKKTENSRKKLRKKLKTQGKNSRFRQIHLVELPKTGPISKPGLTFTTYFKYTTCRESLMPAILHYCYARSFYQMYRKISIKDLFPRISKLPSDLKSDHWVPSYGSSRALLEAY